MRLRGLLICCVTSAALLMPVAAQASVSSPARAETAAGTAWARELQAAQGTERRSAASGTVYYGGLFEACAQFIAGTSYNGNLPNCNPKKWWVLMNITWTDNGTRIWQYSHGCAENGTSVSWCNVSNNGTSELTEGFNYGNGDWARMDVTAGAWCGVRGTPGIPIAGELDNDNSNGFKELCAGNNAAPA